MCTNASPVRRTPRSRGKPARPAPRPSGSLASLAGLRPTVQAITHSDQPQHSSTGETLVDPHSPNPRDHLGELGLQALSARKRERGTHRRPEKSRQQGPHSGVPLRGRTLPVQRAQTAQSQQGPHGDRLRIVEPRMRRPVRIEQVGAIPIGRETTDSGDTGHDIENFPTCRHAPSPLDSHTPQPAARPAKPSPRRPRPPRHRTTSAAPAEHPTT